jgi:hypothetical protein
MSKTVGETPRPFAGHGEAVFWQDREHSERKTTGVDAHANFLVQIYAIGFGRCDRPGDLRNPPGHRFFPKAERPFASRRGTAFPPGF